VTGRDSPVVDSVSAAVYKVPTDQPEADGTLAWSSTTLVIASVSGGGRTGLGYTYGSAACKPVIEGELASAVAGLDVFDTGAALEAMVRAVRNAGRPGLVSYAISAVETALWDLNGTLLGVPVVSLLGAVCDTVPVYGSGGFTTYDEPAARTQLERWTGDLAIPRVKIKIGESWGAEEGRDLARIVYARKVIGPETALDLVLPAIDSRGNAAAASPRLAGNKLRVAEIWITLAASPAADRIASLARATADGHPVVGTCEIVVEPQGGAGRRTYVVGGCFAKSVDVADNARRVTLGYSTIRIL